MPPGSFAHGSGQVQGPGGGSIGGLIGSVPSFFFREVFAMRVIALSVLCFVLGCGPSKELAPLAKQVGWNTLVNEYRDHREAADREYLNQPIQVYLPARTYKLGKDRIEARFGLPGMPGALVFECHPPVTDRFPLLVTGICRGTVRDGIERANGIDWFIRIEGCSVTVLGQ